ncbi:MAG: hypothetical protein ACM3JB_20005 [Acidobacteriaceae bacterium]
MPIVRGKVRVIEMNKKAQRPAQHILSNLHTLLPGLESVYKDIHSHPELSMQEQRTAGIAADRLRAAGYDVTTGIGKTGVVGVLRNGDGPVVMLRADVRKRVLAAIERIVSAEAEASGAPKKPEITPLDHYAFVKNDPEATKQVLGAFRSYFPPDHVKDTQPTTASEDFGSFGTEWQVPSVFWFVGGKHPETYAKAEKSGTIAEIPTNHNPRFAPVIHPTLEAGVEAIVVAAQAWLSTQENN